MVKVAEEAIAVVGASSNVASNTLGYDAGGRLARETWGDGFFVTYEYLATGAMSVVRENGGFALASFGYDTLGRRTSLTRGNGTVTSYHYDAGQSLDQLSHGRTDRGGKSHIDAVGGCRRTNMPA